MCHKLFHYTNRDGSTGIYDSKTLRQSTTTYDAAFGPGVYFTKMSPQHYSKEKIAENNWGVGSWTSAQMIQQGKLDWVIIVYFPDNEPRLKKKCVSGRDIWAYEGGDIKLGYGSGDLMS